MAAKPRVHEVARELQIPVQEALHLLKNMGEIVKSPSSTIQPPVARKLRAAVEAGTLRATPHPQRPRRPKSAAKHIRAYRLRGQARERFRKRLVALIPEVYEALVADAALSDAVVVLRSWRENPETTSHALLDIDGVPISDIDPATTANALKPLRELYATFEAASEVPPPGYIGVDISQRTAWVARSLKAARRRVNELDARTLEPVTPSRRAPMLAPKAVVMDAAAAADVSDGVGSTSDRPEETFLITDQLLRLAVDSLGFAPSLSPLPVHINAMWVFARPVIMTLQNGEIRGVRAIWFRQGGTMWRLRTYVARPGEVKLVGEQIVGRVPFVPAWDADHPEQQMLAAVWALMAQGDVAETRDAGRGADGPQAAGIDRRHQGLRVVDVKAGTSHAKFYSRQSPTDQDRPAWSVRGHWRRQPYPSLGLDESGKVRTQLIWIATYVKGSPGDAPAPQKVLKVGT